MSDEIETPTAPPPVTKQFANLGLATTAELLDELRTRIEVDYFVGGGGLGYTTVDGRPTPSGPAA